MSYRMNLITEKTVKVIVTMIMSLLMVSISQLVIDNNVFAGAALQWPVPGHTQLSQGLHDKNAIDINDGNIAGATVVAACGGTVKQVFKCTQQHYGSFGDCNGFGTGLVIIGDDGRTYQYAHMQANSIPSNVYVGAYIAAGQTIGGVGTTGNSSGNHLHFGICYGNYWEGYGDPLAETYASTSEEAEHTHCFSDWETVTESTCEEDGLMKRVCSCGAYETKSSPATGHSFGEWELFLEPECEEAGEECRFCENCGKEESREIEAVGHDYEHAEKIDVAGDKYCYEECPRCGSVINIKVFHGFESNEDKVVKKHISDDFEATDYDKYTEEDDDDETIVEDTEEEEDLTESDDTMSLDAQDTTDDEASNPSFFDKLIAFFENLLALIF